MEQQIETTDLDQQTEGQEQTEQVETAEDTLYEDTQEEQAEDGEQDTGQGEGDETGEEGSDSENEEDEQLYSLEEFSQLDPYDVDPARLPGSAKAVHQKYMDVYQRQILPELQELRDFKQKVMRDVQSQQPKNSREAFNNEVRSRAMKELGVTELDDMNFDHLIEIQRQASLLTGEISEQDKDTRQKQEMEAHFAGIIQRVAAEIPDFKLVDIFAKQEFNNLPYSKAQTVLNDLASGDYNRVKAVYEMFAQRRDAAKKKPQTKEKPGNPPTVIKGSNDRKESKRLSVSDWAGAKQDDQAQMLIDAGLV